jgi:hypothetical protein
MMKNLRARPKFAIMLADSIQQMLGTPPRRRAALDGDTAAMLESVSAIGVFSQRAAVAGLAVTTACRARHRA